MKEKIIEKIKEIVPANYDLLDELIIDTIAEEMIIIFKETIIENSNDFEKLIN